MSLPSVVPVSNSVSVPVSASYSASVAKPEFSFSTYQLYESDGLKFLETIQDDVGFLMRSPAPVIYFTIVYLVAVCLIGPKLMQSRQPFKLFNIIRFYNLIMVLLAAYLVVCLNDAIGGVAHLFDCTKTFNFADGSSTRIYAIANFLLAVRLSEYLDTIFFTLRKKQQQITFLHVFHHAFVPIYAYWIMRTAPLRFNAFIMILNSFIHVIMYFYYFISTFQLSADTCKSNTQLLLINIISKILLFKRYMTLMQILQFVSLAAYVTWAALKPNQCAMPKTYLTANLLLALGFLSLFLHFYIRAYSNKPSAKFEPKKGV